MAYDSEWYHPGPNSTAGDKIMVNRPHNDPPIQGCLVVRRLPPPPILLMHLLLRTFLLFREKLE